jgi:hypothetical protein
MIRNPNAMTYLSPALGCREAKKGDGNNAGLKNAAFHFYLFFILQ